ncbi:unnamed protein product [Polarella glacialis]|uniref:Uncharacterized protein n=1 Tax=Polarella glacialis TaxID=89957 RepID=A0A813H2W1_POLGL|nr:unnamed protein product [Polarella glacialis]
MAGSSLCTFILATAELDARWVGEIGATWATDSTFFVSFEAPKITPAAGSSGTAAGGSNSSGLGNASRIILDVGFAPLARWQAGVSLWAGIASLLHCRNASLHAPGLLDRCGWFLHIDASNSYGQFR